MFTLQNPPKGFGNFKSAEEILAKFQKCIQGKDPVGARECIECMRFMLHQMETVFEFRLGDQARDTSASQNVVASMEKQFKQHFGETAFGSACGPSAEGCFVTDSDMRLLSGLKETLQVLEAMILVKAKYKVNVQPGNQASLYRVHMSYEEVEKALTGLKKLIWDKIMLYGAAETKNEAARILSGAMLSWLTKLLDPNIYRVRLRKHPFTTHINSPSECMDNMDKPIAVAKMFNEFFPPDKFKEAFPEQYRALETGMDKCFAGVILEFFENPLPFSTPRDFIDAYYLMKMYAPLTYASRPDLKQKMVKEIAYGIETTLGIYGVGGDLMEFIRYLKNEVYGEIREEVWQASIDCIGEKIIEYMKTDPAGYDMTWSLQVLEEFAPEYVPYGKALKERRTLPDMPGKKKHELVGAGKNAFLLQPA